MAKTLDNQLLITATVDAINGIFQEKCHVEPSGEPVIVERDIIEFDSRMRVFPMEKFNGSSYVAAMTYHLSAKELESVFAVGTVILFVKEEIVDKIVKGMGGSSRDLEDDSRIMESIGQVCQLMATRVKDRLVSSGYQELLVSLPLNYKNSIPEGVPFNYDLYQKQEIAFNFWKQKCVVVEICMGAVPQAR